MIDTKKIKNLHISNESFALSQQLRPKAQPLERSFNGASSLKPVPTTGASNSPVNGTTASVPTPPTRTRTP